MSRPLRIQLPGLTYHVTARGVRRTAIYLDDVDRRRFLAILADVVARFALRCHAYCEMTNHYHLAITTADANLSRAMRQLNGDYASWWNWRHRYVGHVFQGRFGAQIVQDDVHLATVCRYIVRNPVRAGIVRVPEQWGWSSYRATIGMTPSPQFLDCDRLMEIVSPDNPADGRRQFRRHVMSPDTGAPLSRAAIIGDDAFVAKFQPYRRRHPEVVRRDARRGLEAIFAGAITRHARDAAIMEAFNERYALADIARYLDLHPSTVSKVVSRRCQVVK
jgi:putative transposase